MLLQIQLTDRVANKFRRFKERAGVTKNPDALSLLLYLAGVMDDKDFMPVRIEEALERLARDP